MDRGSALAVLAVVLGWSLVIASLLLIDVIVEITPGEGFLPSVFRVSLGLVSLVAALYLWYGLVRYLFNRIRTTDGGPGGT